MAAKITADTDQLTPYLLGQAEILGPVASSFFLLVLLAAAMSSLDSVLLVTASAITRDLQLLKDDDPRAIGRTRAWVVAVSLAAMIVALNPFADIVEITAFSGSLYAACFLSTMVLGLYWNRPGAPAAIAAMVTGGLSVIAWWLAKRAGWTDLHEVYIGLVVSTVVYVAAAMIGPARNPSLETTD
jgi:sodium/proline symporter